MKVGFIGCGKLGMPCAEVMADAGHDVIGYDVVEVTGNIEMSDTLEGAVHGRDLVFIAVQTPHDPKYEGDRPTCHLENKDFDYSYVEDILKRINRVATKDQLIVLISTVLPGTTREKFVGLVGNTRFIYNPYLIAMGSVKEDMVKPEMIIIGTQDGTTTGDASLLIEFYKSFVDCDRYAVGTWEEAEAIKVFYNTFISAKLGIVNMVQDVAERIGHMNVDVVTDALANSTQRIMGPRYMTAGMGDAGPCHPRDNIALRYLAEKIDLGYDLFDAVMSAREKQARNIADVLVEEARRKYSSVCIVGKAYKPGVDLTNGSYSLLVGHYVVEHGVGLDFYDPNTGDNYFPSECRVFLIGYWDTWTADIVFPHGSVVIDPWRKMPPYDGVEVIHYGNTRNRKCRY